MFVQEVKKRTVDYDNNAIQSAVFGGFMQFLQVSELMQCRPCHAPGDVPMLKRLVSLGEVHHHTHTTTFCNFLTFGPSK